MALHRLCSLSLSFLLLGCVAATATDPITAKLSNRGVILLSPDNPYLAANQFLSKQTASSRELSGFLQLKGYPAGFEVNQTTFGPLSMTLYYPHIKEKYELEQSESSWIISGPFPLSDAAVQALGLSITSSTPVITPKNSPTPNSAKPSKVKTTPIPTPTPTATQQPTHTTLSFSSPEPTPTKIQVTSALEVAEIAQELAEISPRGDLVHYVTMQGETLSIISRWYTGERENAAKIGRLNRMKNSDALAIGDTIVIPSYMIKNKTRLTEPDLKRISELASKEKNPKK